jgi:hypothetical protein
MSTIEDEASEMYVLAADVAKLVSSLMAFKSEVRSFTVTDVE